ncbi:hypothetical protein lerEdw1_008224 [Lerista edwardsae]|nr:hypothetical protein lerEdw1_008224 [Lerista edwardsae]
MVSTRLWDYLREICQWDSRKLKGFTEGTLFDILKDDTMLNHSDVFGKQASKLSMLVSCYQWLKEKIVSEEGRKQQTKLKDLFPIAERLGCTLPQLAVAFGGPNTDRLSMQKHLDQEFLDHCKRWISGHEANLLKAVCFLSSQHGAYVMKVLCFPVCCPQVLPKMSSHIVNEIDNILGNKPYSKKDYRS